MGAKDLVTRFLFFSSDCMLYDQKISSNEEMIAVLEKLAVKNVLSLDSLLNVMQQVERSLFTVRKRELEDHFEEKKGFPLSACNLETREDVNMIIASLPYKINTKVAVNKEHSIFNNYLYMDLLLFKLLKPRKDDRVAVIGDVSGYLSALLARASREVTLFKVFPEHSSFAERNLDDAGISNYSSVDAGIHLDALREHESSYDKVVCFLDTPRDYFSLIKKTVKLGGIAVGIVNSRLVLFREKEIGLVELSGASLLEGFLRSLN